MEGAKRRDEEPAIGARRRAQQPTHRAVKSLWEPGRPAAWDAVADAGRIAAQKLVASCECISGTGWPKCITSIATLRIIAWRVWYLTMLGRTCPELPCNVVFADDAWQAVYIVAKRQ